MPEPLLVLASSSPYRRDLLGRLGLNFLSASPDIDETPLPGEDARALVARLAHAKARALSAQYPQHLIIGSDQVACLDKQILTKPHTSERALAQLGACSGRRVRFETGLALLDTAHERIESRVESFAVEFRELSDEEIQCYVEREQPLDCAGSFKAEGLGITLFKAMEGRDPNSLVGLPMIALCDMLRRFGFSPLNGGTTPQT